jgi:hypothetical protein
MTCRHKDQNCYREKSFCYVSDLHDLPLFTKTSLSSIASIQSNLRMAAISHTALDFRKAYVKTFSEE